MQGLNFKSLLSRAVQLATLQSLFRNTEDAPPVSVRSVTRPKKPGNPSSRLIGGIPYQQTTTGRRMDNRTDPTTLKGY